MVTLPMLWLPILVSAVIVFVASNILWMVLPFWHRHDYGKLPKASSDQVVGALGDVPSGQYMFPSLDWQKLTPEEREALHTHPGGLLLLRNPMKMSLPAAMAMYFLYNLVIAIFVAYAARIGAHHGAPYPHVFRVAGTAGILAYTFGTIPDSIWYGKPWSVTVKHVIDGILYGLLIGGTFGWLWPR